MRQRPQSTPPPDPARIVYPLVAVRPDARMQAPAPLTRADLIPVCLHRSVCAPGPSDPQARREYLGSPQWTRGFLHYLAGVSVPWWRHPYVVARLGLRDPRALALVQLANEVATATGSDLIAVVPQVAARVGLRPRPAWLLYLRTEQMVQRLYRVRTTQAA